MSLDTIVAIVMTLLIIALSNLFANYSNIMIAIAATPVLDGYELLLKFEKLNIQ